MEGGQLPDSNLAPDYLKWDLEKQEKKKEMLCARRNGRINKRIGGNLDRTAFWDIKIGAEVCSDWDKVTWILDLGNLRSKPNNTS
ncbi:hypothetical protein CDAR_198171 [Caerostris darwini]|uniref:Uncharacterized protein n=1 Tax=Caerostris darwini TaxID=1538125 RepID=A0AAV4RJ76_9ARAC|nr:hypothetical protein CDAR_198171 [Caerostris darwini]